MRRLCLPLFALLLALGSIAPASAAPFTTTLNPSVDPLDQDIQYFPQTGHHLRREFKRFWQEHGGLDILGLPLTEAFVEDGLTVQYLERARLELHPENPAAFRVQLTRLGAHFTEGRSADPAFAWLSAAPAGSDRGFFAESGHTIGGAFRGFWEGRGGLAAFGFPISEELAEVSATNGLTYTVQYYERARFEYHPENAGTPYEVQLSQIGRAFLEQRPVAQAQTAPVTGLQLLGRAMTGFPGSAVERRQNIARVTLMLDGTLVAPGATHSFAAVGDFSAENGFVEGYGIIGGGWRR